LTVQCFDTFRGFLHKLYATTMDGKGPKGTYNFFSRRLEGSRGQGIGHRGQLPPLPCHSAGADHGDIPMAGGVKWPRPQHTPGVYGRFNPGYRPIYLAGVWEYYSLIHRAYMKVSTSGSTFAKDGSVYLLLWNCVLQFVFPLNDIFGTSFEVAAASALLPARQRRS